VLECEPEPGKPQCTVCKLCESECPVKVDLDLIIPRYRYLLPQKTSHRGVFETIGRMITYSKTKEWLKDVETDENSGIAYFPGCAPLFDLLLDRDTNYSGGAQAAVKVLNKMGIKPRIIYSCCGHDQYYAGQLDEFQIIKKNLKSEIDNDKIKTIITGCAECYHMLKNHHKTKNVVFFTDYIKKNIKKLSLSNNKNLKIAYHDPCRLGHHNEIYESPRELLKNIAKFTEMKQIKDKSVCCSVSAWLNCNFESRKIRIERLKEASDVGADIIATSCPKCRIHLDCINFDKLEKDDNLDIKIIDIQELIGLAAGVYDPFSDNTSYHIDKVETQLPEIPQIEYDSKRYLTDETLKNIYICSTCMKCSEICKSSYNTPEMVIKFRQKLYEMDMIPKVHKMALNNIQTKGNPFGESPEKREEFLEDVDDYKKPGSEVLLFTGCVPSLQDILLLPAVFKILKSANVDFSVLGSDESCCGFLAHLVGSKDDFQKCMDINKKKFKKTGAKTIITPCSGCYRAIHDLYPTFTDFDYNVKHTVEFFEELASKGKLKFEKPIRKKVVYHDPCDLGRHCKIYDPPRSLLKRIPELELIEFPANKENANCCGGGGGLKGFDNDLSLETAMKRVKEAIDLGAEMIVSACPTCKDNLSLGVSLLRKSGGPKIKVMDLVEFLAKAL
jgi:Fe-S oxidoreductase